MAPTGIRFLCVANSARLRMGEALARQLLLGLMGQSAGCRSATQRPPLPE